MARSMTRQQRRAARRARHGGVVRRARRRERRPFGFLYMSHPDTRAELGELGEAVFSETPKGYRARDRWARRYDSLNGAPEGDGDR